MTLLVETNQSHCQIVLLMGLFRSFEIVLIVHAGSGLGAGIRLGWQGPQKGGQSSVAQVRRPTSQPFLKGFQGVRVLDGRWMTVVELEGLLDLAW
jgi:hypothetical protein